MKIGMVAMSGIRCCDSELLKRGLTLPGFVERSQTIASLPSLGLLTLAGMTPEHHDIRYVEKRDLNESGEDLSDADLIAISSFSAQMPEAYALADEYRAQGVPVVLGGLHVSSLPEEAAEHADCVVVGEGESVWPQILEDAAAGRLQPRYDAPEFDLAEAPMPAYELLDHERYNRLTIQTSRGCPLKCEFCASSILLTNRYKQKPVEKVLAEIDRIRGLWPRPFIEFADDNSLVNHRYWKQLLKEMIPRRVRWFTETDLSVHEDEELLELMRDSGCVEVLIGLESPTPASLHGLEMKNDRKHRWWSDYLHAVRRIQSHGVRVNGCFILGLDGHGPEVFDEVYQFAVESELYDIQITYQTPFPGTPLYERLAEENRLLAPGDWSRCTLFDVNYEPQGMSTLR